MIKHPIRQAMPQDLEQVRKIAEVAYAPYVTEIGMRPGPMDDDYAAHLDAGHLWVWPDNADSNAAILGILVVIPQEDALLLENIALAPKAQGRGIFRLMMDFAERQAISQNLPAITLYTNAKMTRNLTVYPHLGYHKTHRSVQNGFDRVFFRKDLA